MGEAVAEQHVAQEFVPEEATLLQVHGMVARLRDTERAAAQITEAKRALVATYDDALAQKAEQAAALRAALLAVLERGPFGSKLEFPDVGKIHTTTTGGNLALVNQEAAVSQYGFRFTKEVTDIAEMNAWARQHHKESGEIPVGYEHVPKRRTLVASVRP